MTPISLIEKWRLQLKALDAAFTELRDRFDSPGLTPGVWYTLHAAGLACDTAITALLATKEMLEDVEGA